MASAKNVIELKHVTKKYGSTYGVRDISLKVPKGTVFGFLGPNGAGKSTTINMLVDFIRPTEGEVKLFGMDSVSDSLKIRERIGFLAGDFALDKGLTGWQQLEYYGNLRGKYDKEYVTELAERLDCNLSRKFKHLSRGNKQKVGLIAALMHQPELLIFDEPTSGLDPLIQAEFNKIILEQSKRGATVFISSHILSEVQEICDHVAFIRLGEIVASRPLTEIMASTARSVSLVFSGKPAVSKLEADNQVQNLQILGKRVTFLYNGKMNQLLKIISEFKLDDASIESPDLESIFMQFYGPGQGGKDA